MRGFAGSRKSFCFCPQIKLDSVRGYGQSGPLLHYLGEDPASAKAAQVVLWGCCLDWMDNTKNGLDLGIVIWWGCLWPRKQVLGLRQGYVTCACFIFCKREADYHTELNVATL